MCLAMRTRIQKLRLNWRKNSAKCDNFARVKMKKKTISDPDSEENVIYGTVDSDLDDTQIKKDTNCKSGPSL